MYGCNSGSKRFRFVYGFFSDLQRFEIQPNEVAMAFGALGLGFYSSPDIRFGIGFEFAIGHSKHTCFVFWDHRILCGCWGYCTMFPSPEIKK